MSRKKNNGFTLVELIVVVVILGVLAAILVPQYIQYVERSREGVCASNRAAIEREISIARSLSDAGLTREQAKAFLDSHSGKTICPGGGTISVDYDNSAEYYTVLCSEHGDLPNRAAMDTLKKFQDIINNYNDYGINSFNNDLFRNYYRNHFTNVKGQWDSISYNGNTYYIQPYIDAWGEGASKEFYLYANTQSTGNGGWNTNLIYNHEDNRWYTPKNGKAVGFANKSWDEVKSLIANWEPVEVTYN